MKTVYTTALLLAVAMSAVAMSAMSAEIVHEVLPSRILGEDRPLHVVLPENHDAGMTYPVVYALDGNPRHIQDLAASMHAGQPDLIVVGIENVDRSRDMFPEEVELRHSRGGGGGNAFLEFITTELIPHIEARYPTDGYRILSGQSNSGFFVLYAMQTRPTAFQAWLAISPMIGWDADLIYRGTQQLFEDEILPHEILSMVYGDDDYDEVTQFVPAYEDLLRAAAGAGFRRQVEVIQDGGHVPPDAHERGIHFIFTEREQVRTCFGIEMVDIPAGNLEWPAGPTRHAMTVHIEAYSIGKYEITQTQWKAVMGQYPEDFDWEDLPSEFRADGAFEHPERVRELTEPSGFLGDDLPAEGMSWRAAQDFCTRLSEITGQTYRLPTRAEWEYACRAGSPGQYYFGDDPALLDRYEWYGENSGKRPHPVGQKNPNPWELHDMSGNVAEWTSTIADMYIYEQMFPGRNFGPGISRVYKGSHYLHNARAACIEYGHTYQQDLPRGPVGLRVVRDLD